MVKCWQNGTSNYSGEYLYFCMILEKILLHFHQITLIWSLMALITFVFLWKSNIRAPYGRHSQAGWGFMIDNKFAWFLMELPALLLIPLIPFYGPSLHPFQIGLIALWTLHYGYRTLIFPLRIKTKGKKMPISIVISALFFNLINGLLNGLWITFLAPEKMPFQWQWIGLLIFIAGWAINQYHDHLLIQIRKHQKGYKIPYGGLFQYISCPNLLGEIIEWGGFAILAWNGAAFSFFFWTCANLIPRAKNHHQWYLEQFPNYPKNRNPLWPPLGQIIHRHFPFTNNKS
ncbi:3-oxo-5-alpha-steroid 4-dehydrogenase [Persicobacter diffluens]|uniref:3-oxo-5-alpha-steroid 4-dehydrogenase n=2 Tax=Persicobacter diffluens TaxID=981 RepID=A0AAN5AJ90_9BACT|nr:3-oxo-5-alpha-steroid 4-dehydrogenase [Persicobacter diffluens]